MFNECKRCYPPFCGINHKLGSPIEMKTHHYFSVLAFAASIVLTVIGFFTGAAVLVGLATAIELVASIVSEKKTNT